MYTKGNNKEENLECIFDKLFPLAPQKDQSLCRDAYLKKKLAHIDMKDTQKENLQEPFDLDELQLQELPYNVEYLLVKDLIRGTRRANESKKVVPIINKATKTKSNYELRYIKEFLDSFKLTAVHLELTTLMEQIKLFHSFWENNTDKLEYNIFSWSVKDFLMRRKMENHTYLDVIERSLTLEELNTTKHVVDLQELHNILNSMDECILNEIGLNDFVYDEIKEAQTMLNLREYIMQPLTIAYERNKVLKWQVDTENARRGVMHSKRHNTPEKIEQMEIDLETNGPIESRYKVNWYRTLGAQITLADDMKREALINQIDKWSKTTDYNNVAIQCAISSHYIAIAKYKAGLEQMEQKYDEDLEAMENELQITKNKIVKANDDFIWYQQEVERFHRKIFEIEVEKASAVERESQWERETLSKKISIKKSRNGKGKPKSKPKK